MMRTVRVISIGLALLVAAAAGGPAREPRGGASAAEPLVFRGACYCRAAETLSCTPALTERECRRQCDEEICDDWFWNERLPCWNWGYGG